MYYEEKIIDGVFYFKDEPKAAWKIVSPHHMFEKVEAFYRKYEDLKSAVHDFMQDMDRYNVELPIIMYEDWNELNKLIGRN